MRHFPSRRLDATLSYSELIQSWIHYGFWAILSYSRRLDATWIHHGSNSILIRLHIDHSHHWSWTNAHTHAHTYYTVVITDEHDDDDDAENATICGYFCAFVGTYAACHELRLLTCNNHDSSPHFIYGDNHFSPSIWTINAEHQPTIFSKALCFQLPL